MEKDWLDNTTKNRCVDKVSIQWSLILQRSQIYVIVQVNAITRQIAYPDFVKDYKELDKFYIDVSHNVKALAKLSTYVCYHS